MASDIIQNSVSLYYTVNICSKECNQCQKYGGIIKNAIRAVNYSMRAVSNTISNSDALRVVSNTHSGMARGHNEYELLLMLLIWLLL